jgi:hypothetical protein
MTEEERNGEYEPSEPAPPVRQPPLRSTAPQSPSTTGQVAVGFAVLFVGFVVVFGLPVALA